MSGGRVLLAIVFAPAGCPGKNTPDSELVSVRVLVSGDPVRARLRAREVLSAVLASLPRDWPDNTQESFLDVGAWEKAPPTWFVDLRAAETSEAKVGATAGRLHGLPSDVRDLVSYNTAPSLGSWCSCFSDLSVLALVGRRAGARWVHADIRGVRLRLHSVDLSWLLIAAGGWNLEYSDLPRP